jgi:microcystin-dependent protein
MIHVLPDRFSLNGARTEIAALVSLVILASFSPGIAQVNPYLGEIRLFAGNFAPTGWALCDGSLLAISQNQALFSILGTTYGGNGTTTFGLPDLRGRVPIGMGNGQGLTARTEGEVGGLEQVTLTQSQIPAHTHSITLSADSTIGSTDRPKGGLPSRNAAAVPTYGTTANTTLSASSATVGSTGGGQPVAIMPPYLSINYIIALQGVFPPRN